MKIKFVTFGGQIFSNQIRLCVYLLSKQARRHAEPLVTQCKVFSAILTEKMAWNKMTLTILKVKKKKKLEKVTHSYLKLNWNSQIDRYHISFKWIQHKQFKRDTFVR